jgi:hypothetical protein
VAIWRANHVQNFVIDRRRKIFRVFEEFVSPCIAVDFMKTLLFLITKAISEISACIVILYVSLHIKYSLGKALNR